MGTTSHSSFHDFGIVIPWPGEILTGPKWNELCASGLSPRHSIRESVLPVVLQWQPATPEKSSKALDEIWKHAAERTGSAAKILQDRMAKRLYPSGRAKIINDHLAAMKEALLDARSGIEKAHRLPHVSMEGQPVAVPRSFALARVFLYSEGFAFNEREFARFLETVQENLALRTAEIWHLKPFLEFLLLEQIAGEIAQFDLRDPSDDAPQGSVADSGSERLLLLVKSLNDISSLEWKAYFERVCLTEKILRDDPQCAYERMDADSREAYRAAVANFAAHSNCAESEVARKAISLAEHAQRSASTEARSRERRTHVGYYLVDAGQDVLKYEIGYRAPFLAAVRGAILKRPDSFFFGAIELLTFGAIALLMTLLHVSPSRPFAIALFVLPALECAVTTVNLLTNRIFSPRRIPKLDFSKGIPGECATVVAVPTLLTSEAQVRQTVKGLEIRFLANRDPNLHFALITDLPDAKHQFDDREALAELCSDLVRNLDERYAHENKGRMFHFHRHRSYNATEGVWMGWERKRGKLLEFNRFLLHQDDQFPRKAGEISLLRSIRYVITLDLDTQLPPGAGHRLVGTLAHPLNRAVIDPEKNVVEEGYGILQPRVDISVKSASRSRFASLLSGDTGFDIYTRAVSDVYQDLFGEGIFTGKGIYEVETFQKVLERRFPCNQVLSHDLIEGAYARAGLVSDVEVVDDYPSHYSAFSSRKHRWVRGDWQIISSLLPRVRNYFGQLVPNPLSLVARWKIFDNLRRSLTEFATLLLLVYGWLLKPEEAVRWTLTAIAVLLFPTLFQFLLSVFTAGKAWFRPDFWVSLGRDFVGDFARASVRLAFLCHQSLIDVDAVVRSLVRMKITHRKLLEWNTAADAEVKHPAGNLADVYLKYSLMIVVAIGPLVFLLHPNSLRIAMPFLVLWAAWAWLGEWLNRPRPSRVGVIPAKDQDTIRSAALRTWRFFHEFSTAAENWLIPDFVQVDPPQIAHRVSPTNLGLLLNSRLAASDLGYVTTQEFVRDTERTFETVDRMPKWKGHLYNWYSNRTLEPDSPRFVSTVDNGNLLGSLWTLKQGCLEMITQPWPHPALWSGLRDHANLLEEVIKQNRADSELAAAAVELTRAVEALASERTLELDVLRSLEIDALIFVSRVSKVGGNENEEVLWWARELAARVASMVAMLETFAPWLEPQLASACPLSKSELQRIAKGLSWQSLPRTCREICEKLEQQLENSSAEPTASAKRLRFALERSARLAEETVSRLNALAAIAQSIGDRMDFSILYDPKKKLFSIGYEDGELEISKYNYDLLASEARTAVFVAIAKGEVPQESWVQLKRAYRTYKREDVLLSWSGTAFEYLMPCVWMRAYPNTVLEHGALAVIAAQKKFAQENGGIPWGISECACAERMPEGDHMYHAFGVPALAIHTDDCSGDLVVAPYATFLSLMFDAKGAVQNLHRMKGLGWLSQYGFYDAADYTPRRNSEPRGHTVVRNWMAHHQGMSLLAVANVLCDSTMQRRFHAEPRVAAAERVLHEKLPRVLNYEEDLAAMSKSAPALADVAPQMPDLAVRAPASTLL